MPDEPIVIDNQVQVVQIRAIWHLYSRGRGESSWSFIMPSAAGPAQHLVLDKWVDVLRDPFRTARPGGWTLVELRSEDRFPQIRAPVVASVSLGPLDPDEGVAMPPQVTPVISWRTGIIGRSNRGRTYMGPYGTQSMGSDNNINDPADSAVQAFAEAMIGNFTGTPAEPGPFFAIVSRQHDLVALEHPTYTLPFEYVYLGRWGHMRRRFKYSWAS